MKNHFGTVGWIFRVTGKSKYGILALTALETLESLSSVLFALLLKNVIDCATSGDSRGFLFAMVQLAVLIVLQILIRTIIRRCTEGTKSMAENSLRLHLYEVCLTREYAALSAFHTGELQNRIISDSAVVAEGMVSIIPGMAAMLVKLIGSAAVLMAIDYRFTLIFIAGGIMLVLAVAAMRRVMKRMHKRVQTADGAVRSYLQETLGNLMVLRSFSAEKHAAQAAAQKMNYHRQERMRRNTVSCAGNAGIAAVMNVGYLFGLIWGGTGILRGVVSYGTLAAILQLVNQIQAPFVNMSSYLPTYFAMLASAERLLELEQLPAENTADRLTQQQRDAQYAAMEAIRVENITFAYPNDDAAVLTNASITIPKGAFVAITGRSGIGKSTLLKLLLSVFVPQEGSISLLRSDGTTIPVTASERPMFAYVPQGNCLMSGTIAEAICFAAPTEKDEGELRAACEIACVDFISSLPNGLETKIGEKGSGLSEGQLQRLSIARAIYCGAPILLLDEATSALDAQTEERLLTNLRQLTDKTVLIVTHRPAALAVCDVTVEINGKKFRA